jgi:serine/threonine protein kinase
MNSQNQSPEQLLTIGSVIDKNYRVKRRTRFTEKSEIYKVNDIKLGRTVAIKMLRPGQEEERKNQFSEEYKTLAKLDGIRKHPNIITIHAAGEYHGNPYMVMEYIEGDDLDELLEANRTFSLEKILRIEEELC